MTPDEASAAERDIIATGNRLRSLLVEFYERRGWAALGYASWRGWASARLGQAERTAYAELTAGIVEREIVQDPAQFAHTPREQLIPLASAFVEMPRGPGADMRPVQIDGDAIRETWDRANEIADESGKPRTAVQTNAPSWLLGALRRLLVLLRWLAPAVRE